MNNAKIIKEFNIIEHFTNKDFNVECGIYEIKTEKEHCFVVQTQDEYKVIIHSLKKTMLYPPRENVVQEIKELLKENKYEQGR